jgi:hypothetical protein
MIMEGILNNWKGFLKEGFTEQGTPDLKYYAFDWDDNIVFMPTKIILLDTEGKEVGMSTHAFATERSKIGKEEFEYEGHIIKDFAQNPFRNFRVEGDDQFLKDAPKASLGPSFKDFKECVEGASIFAIITARGHNIDTLKEACKSYIMSKFGGIDTEKVVSSIKKYNELYGSPSNKSNSQLVDDYLKLCQFSPVSNPEIAGNDPAAAASPEELKASELRRFITHVDKQVKRINKNITKGQTREIGFSDDDPKNVDYILSHFALRDQRGRFRKGGKKIKVKYTGQH